MPLPDNTVADDDGHRALRLGRDGRHVQRRQGAQGAKPGDYKDPGWYKHPPGTQAYEMDGGPLAEATRFKDEGGQSMPVQSKAEPDTEVKVRKPSGHSSHH